MFDYKEFKKEMSKRGHEVHKNGKYLTIIPNNNYEGYDKGFFVCNGYCWRFWGCVKVAKYESF